ncbi:MAG: hypothetical protein SPK09_07585 [Porphyromonas sp.]|nr:hypothetical protein [Porphyromonas sp.]
MIQAILLNTFLCLVIVWLLLLIYYSYCYIRFSLRWGKQEEQAGSDKAAQSQDTEQKPLDAHTLVGKSKGLSSSDFPRAPSISLAETREEKSNTFVPQEAENPDDEPTISDEDNEMDVAYTTDEVDEDEVVREELLLDVSPQPEVSPSAILARDLVRMARWAKSDEELNEEDKAEVQDTLSKVQGTDLMEKYKEHLFAEEAKHSRLLSLVRKAEEEQRQENVTIDETLSSMDASEARPLDYYL